MKIAIRFVRNDVFVVLFVMLSVVLGRLFRVGTMEGSLIWPAIGMGFAFVLHQRTRILPALFIGYFIGINIAFLVGTPWSLMAIFVAVLQSLAFVFTLYMVLRFWQWFKIGETLTGANIAKAAVAIGTLALLSALIGNGLYLMVGFDTFDHFIDNVTTWMVGDIFGYLIIGVPYYFALREDEDPYYTTFEWKEVLFYLSFIVVASALLIEQVPFFNYVEHRYLFIIFAIIMAFNYGYRTPVAFSVMTLIMLSFWPPDFTEFGDYYYVISINTFLVVLTIIVMTIRYFVDSNKEKQVSLEVKSERLDDLLTAAEDLLGLSSDLNAVELNRIEIQAKKIFRVVFTLFNKAEYGSCLLVEEGFRFVDAIGFNLGSLNRMPNQFTRRITFEEPKIVRQSENFVESQFGEYYAEYREKNPPLKESIYFTIRFTEKVLCTLCFDLDSESPHSFSEDDLVYFNSMQKLLNGLFRTDDLISEYETTKDQLVDTMLKTIRLFDEATMNHSVDVAEMAKKLAEHADCDKETRDLLYWAGIMHDIGKLGLPKALITKTGELSLSEYEMMKEHPRLGYETLKDSLELKTIAEYVLHHHERYDGSGYPEGLSGQRLRLPSEILALAEVIATMARRQPYSPQKSLVEIVSELKRLRGKHFSKDVTDIALKAIQYGLLDGFYE